MQIFVFFAYFCKVYVDIMEDMSTCSNALPMRVVSNRFPPIDAHSRKSRVSRPVNIEKRHN